MRAPVFEPIGGPEVLQVPTHTHASHDPVHGLFARLCAGTLKVAIDARYPLAEGATARAQLESRRAPGKVLLIP